MERKIDIILKFLSGTNARSIPASRYPKRGWAVSIRRELRSKTFRRFWVCVFTSIFVVTGVFSNPKATMAAPCATGNDVTIAAGCEWAAGTHIYTGTLTINVGVTVTAQGDVGTGTGVTVIVDNLVLNGTISANSEGYDGGINTSGFRDGDGPGGGLTGGFASGGAHGGRGGGNNTNLTYGSAFAPITLGSGGADDGETSGNPGDGGGAVKIFLTGGGTITLGTSAAITANGGDAVTADHGAGSGGSVWIDARNGTISGPGSGTATISANGGAAVSTQGGGSGGGGRVAMQYATIVNGGNITTQAAGGAPGTQSGFFTPGGAGSIFIEDATAANTELIFDNLNRVNANYTDQVASSTYAVDDLTIRNGAEFHVPDTYILSAASTLTGGGTQRPSVTISTGGALEVPTSDFTFDNIDIVHRGSLGRTGGVLTDPTFTNSTYTFDSNNAEYDFTLTGTLARDSVLTLNSGEGPLTSAAIDAANGFAYFVADTSPGTVIKVDLSTFTRVSALTLSAGENLPEAAVIDAANGFLYLATDTAPIRIVKIDLSTFTRVGAITLDSGEDNLLEALAIDTTNGFLYVGTDVRLETYTTPAKVVKIDLSTFTRVGALTLNSGESRLGTMVVDETNGFLYVGNYQTGSQAVTKIDLSGFTRVGSVAASGQFRNSVIDVAGGYAYFGSFHYPSTSMQRIGLSGFTDAGNLTLEVGENVITSMVIDPADGYLYAGLLDAPSKIVQVNLATFTRAKGLTFNSGENGAHSAVIDTANDIAYFGGGTSPGKIVKVTGPYSATEGGLDSLTIGTGATFSQEGNVAFAVDTFSVLSGGTLTHAANASTHANSLVISASTSLTIASGATVNVGGRGYSAANGPGAGVAGANSGGGGSYGGNGGLSSVTSPVPTIGATYGSVEGPSDLGSGGTYTNAAAGGGLVKFTAPTVTLDGSINANGANSTTFGGSGSGGSVWIDAATITTTGSGSISANGGATSTNCGSGGAGGGGRVALTGWTTLASGITSTAYGGFANCSAAQDGGAGTVYLQASASSTGEIVIDNNNPSFGANTTQVASTDETYANITVRNGAKYVVPTGTALSLSPGGTLTGGGSVQSSLTVNSGGTFDPGAATFTFNDIDVANSGTIASVTDLSVTAATFTQSGAGTFSSDVTALSLSSATFTNASSDAGLNLPDITMSSSTYNSNSSNPQLAFTTFTVPSGSVFNDNSSAYYSMGEGLAALSVNGTYSRGSANTLSVDTLAVGSGGFMTHAANTTAALYKLVISATTSVTVSSGGQINTDGRGFTQGNGPGSPTGSSSNCQNGASHGGNGGLTSFIGSCATYNMRETYGSVSAPTEIGSGAYNSVDGGSGGGAIRITAPTVTVDGSITASGNTSSIFDGGGSGGSVWIDATTITTTGSGTVAANGGGTTYAFCGAGGGGGGGRVALTGWTTLSSSIARTAYGYNVTCSSAQDGGAGTVYVKSSSATNGDLVIVNNSPTFGAATTQVYGTSQTYDNITVSNGADYVVPATTSLTLASGGTLTGGGAVQSSLTVNSGGTFDPGAATFTFNDLDVALNGAMSTVTNLSVTSASFTESGTGTFSSTVSALTLTSATYTDASNDDGLNLTSISMSSSTYNNNTSNPGLNLTTFTVPTGSTFNNNSSAYYPMGSDLTSLTVSGTFTQGSANTLFLDTLTVGGTMTHLANSTTALGKRYWLDISATTSVTVSSGGSIDVGGKGFAGNNGPGTGVQGSNCGSGGSYAGLGGQPSCGATVATIGPSYGSVTAPIDLGSGGNYTNAGAGGGAVKIDAATVTIDGTVSANGANPDTFSGGGSGGSVWIDATTITTTGSGTITSNGGAKPTTCSGGGSGGGGRLAFTGWTTLSGSLIKRTYGGNSGCTSAGDGGAGTIFMKSATAPNGDLLVENNDPNLGTYTTQVAATNETYDTLTIRSGAYYRIPGGSSLTLPAAADCSALVGGGTTQASLTADGTLTLPNAACTVNDLDLVVGASVGTLTSLTMTSAMFTVNAKTSAFTASSHNRLVNLTLGSGGGLTTVSNDPFFIDVLTANSGSTMTHAANSTTAAASNTLYVSATTSITVNAGATVSVNSKGYAKSEGPGQGTDNAVPNGGAHGGNGGSSTALGANTNTYGSAEYPSDSGSGGGDDINTGTAGQSQGGGAVRLSTPVTGSLTIASNILADGAIGDAANDDGGGAGGSIWLQGGAVTLTADLSADGGAGDSVSAGCGGGGRIAVYYNTLDYSSGTATASTGCAGARAGTTGSIYFAQFGDLPVAPTNSGTVISPTVLEVGQNVVISATATDDVGVAKIEIYLDGTDPGNLVKTCLFSPAETPALCQYEAGSLSAGNHSVTVISYDSLDQTDSDTVNFTVAGHTSDNTVTLSRTKVSEIASVGLSFVLDGDSTGTLTLTFPDAFTVLSAPTSGSGCLSGFGFAGSTMYATKTGCAGTVTMTGGTVQNPSVAGAYTLTWTNDNGSAQVFIVDDDNFNISASVDPVITFNVGSQTGTCDGTFAGNGGSLALGSLTLASVASSDVNSVPHICTRLSTNAPGGAVVTVRSQNASLASIASPGDTIPSSSATLAAGTTGYGLCVGSGGSDTGRDSTTPVGAAPARVGPFGGSCTTSAHDVGGLTTSPQIVWQVSAASQNAFAKIFIKASLGPGVQTRNDYTDVLTFIATGTF